MSNGIARTAIALATTLFPLVALAGASGTCSSGDDKLTVVDGVIYKNPDNPAEIVVTLASINLNANEIKAAKDPEDAVRKQVWAATLAGQLTITIDNGAVHEIYAHVPPGHNANRRGGTEIAIGQVKLSRSDPKGVAGHYALKGNAKDDLSCDVSFDLNF